MLKYILFILLLLLLYKSFIIIFKDQNITKTNDYFDNNIIDENKKKHIKVRFNLDNNKYHYYNNNESYDMNYNKYGDINLNNFNQSNLVNNTNVKSIDINNTESKNITDIYDNLTSDIRSYNIHIKNNKNDINYNMNYLQTSLLAPKLNDIIDINNVLDNDKNQLYDCNLNQQDLIKQYGGTKFDTYTITK